MRNLRISSDEYRVRIEALQASVRRAGLDLLIVSESDSIYYMTGASYEPLERPFFLLVFRDKPLRLLVPRLEYEHMRHSQTVVNDIHAYWDYPATAERGWPGQLRDQIGKAHRIGVEPALRQDIAMELSDYAPQVQSLVETLRLVKSEVEIAMIRRAAQYADFAVDRLLAASYFGASVAEGFAETRAVTTRIIREVDDWQPLATKVTMATWAAPRSAMPHSVPGLNDRLREGPHVALALTRVNGYAAECERTYFTESPNTEARRAFSAMTEARRIAFGMIRPGLPAGDLDAAVNDYLGREGYGGDDRRLHRTGHGFGLGNHERPWIAGASTDRLAENMVISIEPGIYISGIGGYRHSDTVRVTATGYELLTRCTTDLDHLVIQGWKPRARLKGHLVRKALMATV